MTLSLNDIRFGQDHDARRIAKNDLLVSLMPQDELNELLRALTAARQAKAEATKLAVTDGDLAKEVQKSLRDGTDPAAIVGRVLEARAQRAHRDAALEVFGAAEGQITVEIVGFVATQGTELIPVLGDKLEDLLDRAEPVLVALDGAYDAEAALRAGKGEDFLKLDGLHAEYRRIREAHLALLRASDPSAFPAGAPAIAWAFFGDPEAAFPHLAASETTRVKRDGLDMLGIPASPFDLTDASDFTHLINAVIFRRELGTHVVGASAALSAKAQAAREHAAGNSIDHPARDAVTHGGRRSEEQGIAAWTGGRTVQADPYQGRTLDEG